MTNETKKQIFLQYPEVKAAFDARIGKDMGERDFWKAFFRTYIIDNKAALIGDGGFGKAALRNRDEHVFQIQERVGADEGEW